MRSENYLFGRLFLGTLLLCFATVAGAGEFNQTLNIGDAAPVWENLPGTDGKKHSLSDFKDKDVVVLVFTCASCEYAVEYESRLHQLAKQYAGPEDKVGFIGVCVNRIAADRLDKLTERAKAQQFAFPIMYDESQQIAKDYGAVFTPEVYVLNKQRKINYMGGIDDSSDASKVKKKYLEEAIVATLKGELPLVKESAAIGCQVRWARGRK